MHIRQILATPMRLLLVAVILMSALTLVGCMSQDERDAQADQVAQVDGILDNVLEHLTADNVEQGLDLVIRFAPMVGRDDLAQRAEELKTEGDAVAKVEQARAMIGQLGDGLADLETNLRDPGKPAWMVVLGAVSTIATAVAAFAGVKGQAAASALRGVVAGVEGLTEAGVIPKEDRKTAMKRTLSKKDEALIKRLKSDGTLEAEAKRTGVAVIDARLAEKFKSS